MARLGRSYPVPLIRRKPPSALLAVLFDAAGANASPSTPTGTQANVVTAGTATNSKTWSHTVATDANCLVVPLTVWDVTYNPGTAQSADHSRTLTYNSVAMTSLGATNDASGYGFIEWFYLLNPSTGTHTVSVSVTETAAVGAQPWCIMCDSLSYKNVTTVTAGTATSAASGTPTCQVASTALSRTAAMLSCSVNNPTGYTQTPRSSILSAAQYLGVTSHTMIGDAAGAAGTVTHSEGGTSNVVTCQAINLAP